MLGSLRPEQIPVAEQLLRGGLQAVRQAIEAQNSAAKASGKPPVASDALLAMADELLPTVRLADWKDRASAAQTAGKEYRLRELRAVVAASRTVNLDDEGRAMAKALQESLDQRTTALREEWLARITNALNDGRVQQAVEASIRPPEPGTRCPAELAVRLAGAAGDAMTADLAPEDWMRLLDAVVASPVRRTVKPAGIPDDEVARQAARHAAGAVPALAKLLGLRIPPPPPRPVTSAAAFQSNRRLSVSRRAVKPAASRRCLVVRSPGSARASTSVQPRAPHHCHPGFHEGRADAHAARPRLDVAALDPAAHPPGHGFVRRRRRQEADHDAVVLAHEQLGRGPGPSLEERHRGGLAEQRRSPAHGGGAHQGLGEQPRAGLAVRCDCRSGQLHGVSRRTGRSAPRPEAARPGSRSCGGCAWTPRSAARRAAGRVRGSRAGAPLATR